MEKHQQGIVAIPIPSYYLPSFSDQQNILSVKKKSQKSQSTSRICFWSQFTPHSIISNAIFPILTQKAICEFWRTPVQEPAEKKFTFIPTYHYYQLLQVATISALTRVQNGGDDPYKQTSSNNMKLHQDSAFCKFDMSYLPIPGKTP